MAKSLWLYFDIWLGCWLVLEQENRRLKKLWLDMMMMDCIGLDKQASNENLERILQYDMNLKMLSFRPGAMTHIKNCCPLIRN